MTRLRARACALIVVMLAGFVPSIALAGGVDYYNASGGIANPSTTAPLPSSAYMVERTDVASAARAVTGNSGALTLPEGCTGAKFFLNVSAASGTTPTLDVKIQEKDPATGIFVDLPVAAAFAQKTTTTAAPDSLVVYAGVAATANRAVSNRMPKTYQIVWTIGGTTPSFTFTVGTVGIP